MKVLLFRGRRLISTLIRWQTRGEVSHAAVLVEEPNIIIESWPGKGVQRKAVMDWEGIRLFEVPTTKEQEIKIVEYLKSRLGNKYNYSGVLRFISRRNTKDTEKDFCSELVFNAFKASGINLLERIEGQNVSPQHLLISPLLKEL